MSDYGTSEIKGPKQEIVMPEPKIPGKMEANPEDLIERAKTGNEEPELAVVYEMAGGQGVSPEQAKKTWNSITQGSEHKITACIKAVQGKVDDPGAYCGWLAKQAGYEPER